MKKVKRPDGKIDEVDDNYTLLQGETWFVGQDLTAQLQPVFDAFLSQVSAKISDTEKSLEQKFDAKLNDQITTLTRKVEERKPFAPTTPQGLQTSRKTFGLNPEKDAGDRMAIYVAAMTTLKHTGGYGKYSEIMNSQIGQEMRFAMTEGSDAAGGYLVVDQFETDIISSLGKYGIMNRFVPMLPTNTDTVNLTGLLTGVSVSVVAEGAAISATSQPSLQRPTVSIKTVQAYLTASNQLLMDAVSLRPQILPLFAEAIAKKFDTDWINGTGAATEIGTGLLSTSGALVESPSGQALSTLNYDDFVDAESNFDDVDKDGAIYGFHKTIKGVVRKIKNNDNTPIFQQTMAVTNDGNTREMDRINGYASFTSPAMPSFTSVDGQSNKAFGFLTNPAKITRAYMRSGTTFDVFTSGTDPDGNNHNTTYTSGLRLVFRAGFTNFIPVDIDGNATGLVIFKTPV